MRQQEKQSETRDNRERIELEKARLEIDCQMEELKKLQSTISLAQTQPSCISLQLSASRPSPLSTSRPSPPSALRPSPLSALRPSPPSASRPSPPSASSPIDPELEEWDTVEAFFTWLINRQTTRERQAQCEHAKNAAIKNYCTTKDLKTIEDPRSDLYKKATSSLIDIPDGIARSFRRFLKQYKVVHKEEQQVAANTLIDMQIGSSGFIRSDPALRQQLVM